MRPMDMAPRGLVRSVRGLWLFGSEKHPSRRYNKPLGYHAVHDGDLLSDSKTASPNSRLRTPKSRGRYGGSEGSRERGWDFLGRKKEIRGVIECNANQRLYRLTKCSEISENDLQRISREKVKVESSR